MGRRIAIQWARPGDAPFPRRIPVAALGAVEAFEDFPNPAEPEPRALPGLQTPDPRPQVRPSAAQVSPGARGLEPGVFATLRKIRAEGIKVLCDGRPELQEKFREQKRWCVEAKAVLLRECTARRRRAPAARRLPARAEAKEV